MRFFLYLLVISIFGCSSAFASQWCQWDGTKGINCQNDSKGYITINGVDTKTEALANAAGFYKLTITTPTVTATQALSLAQWTLVNKQMDLTWAVRAKTTAEIDQEKAEVMPLSEYYLWKALLVKGVITQTDAQNALPAEIINAYLARQRLLQ